MIYLIIFVLLLLALLSCSIFYLWRFARIILILEDDISDTAEALKDAELAIENCLAMPMFFDSPEVQKAATNALEQVKVAKLSVAKMVAKFTHNSKNKFIEVQDFEKEK